MLQQPCNYLSNTFVSRVTIEVKRSKNIQNSKVKSAFKTGKGTAINHPENRTIITAIMEVLHTVAWTTSKESNRTVARRARFIDSSTSRRGENRFSQFQKFEFCFIGRARAGVFSQINRCATIREIWESKFTPASQQRVCSSADKRCLLPTYLPLGNDGLKSRCRNRWSYSTMRSRKWGSNW